MRRFHPLNSLTSVSSVNKDIELPRIAVIGQQSAGKLVWTFISVIKFSCLFRKVFARGGFHWDQASALKWNLHKVFGQSPTAEESNDFIDVRQSASLKEMRAPGVATYTFSAQATKVDVMKILSRLLLDRPSTTPMKLQNASDEPSELFSTRRGMNRSIFTSIAQMTITTNFPSLKTTSLFRYLVQIWLTYRLLIFRVCDPFPQPGASKLNERLRSHPQCRARWEQRGYSPRQKPDDQIHREEVLPHSSNCVLRE